jgi:hypothetical protein
MSASQVTAKPNSIPFLLGAGSALTLAWIVSCLSGFHGEPVPFELAWKLSPIGLLLGIDPELARMGSVSSFAGAWGITPDYFVVFLKTCLLEAPFYLWVFRGRGLALGVMALVVANLLTHPAVYFVFPSMFARFLAAVLSAEVFAPSVEAAFVVVLLLRTEGPRPHPLWNPAALIVLANLFSWQMGAFVS